MPTCSQEALEDQVLSVICPLLEQMTTEVFNKTGRMIDDLKLSKNSDSSISNELEKCKLPLTYWKMILDHIEKYKPWKSNSLPSLFKYLPLVMITTCNQCKMYLKKCSDRTLTAIIQEIYREACLVIKQYCNVIHSIQFDTKNGQDLIKHVIMNIANMASVTIYVLGSMIFTWRTFVKLMCDSDLKFFEDKEISTTVLGCFKQLGNDITWLLQNVWHLKPNESERSKQVKCINILLDLFDRLHKSYYFQIKAADIKFFEDMAHFIIQLTGYYTLSLRGKSDLEIPSAEKKIFDQDWPPEVLIYYHGCETFEEALFLKHNHLNDHSQVCHYYIIGFHLSILNKNIKHESKVEAAILNINTIQEDILLRKFRMPINENGVKTTSIYGYTLMSLCDYLCHYSNFIKFESILFKYLFCEKFWSSLLCFDILKYCYRISTEEFVMTHLKFLMMIYKKFSKRKANNFGIILLSKLIIDTLTILPNEKRDKLIIDCQYEEIIYLFLKSHKINMSEKRSIINWYKKSQLFESNDQNLDKAIISLREQPSVKNWIRLRLLFQLIGMEKNFNKNEYTKVFNDIWMLTISSLEEINDDCKRRMMHELILMLIECIITGDFSHSVSFNWSLLSVMTKDIEDGTMLPKSIIIELCHNLKTYAAVLNTSTDKNGGNTIGNLVCHLMENSCSFIFQEVLETFDFIVENSNDNPLIMGMGAAMKKKPNLLKIVPEYLRKKKTVKLSHFSSIKDYIHTFIKYCDHLSIQHKCYNNSTYKRNEKMPKLDDDSLDKKAERISKELMELIDQKHCLNSTIIEKLSNSCHLFINK
ncbi:uncharacterized protein [Chelonus insularis]|nr:uncharacterized protein LOC118071636 isoform X2 [Chelonus insularis]